MREHTSAAAKDKDSFMNMNNAPAEGTLTKKVEKVTAKVPSLGFLGLALGSMAISAGLATLTRKKEMANFVGLWVPTLMLVGIYNKLVKLEGSDRFEKESFH